MAVCVFSSKRNLDTWQLVRFLVTQTTHFTTQFGIFLNANKLILNADFILDLRPSIYYRNSPQGPFSSCCCGEIVLLTTVSKVRNELSIATSKPTGTKSL